MADIKHLVRIANTDLPGHKAAMHSIAKIKGVNIALANAICNILGVSKTEKLGLLSEADIKKLNGLFEDPSSIPVWMRNRRNDYETGEDTHIIGASLTFTNDNDVKRLKKIKSNRGMRHQWGLPLRGQRTSSNHRRTKAKNASAAKRTKKS